MEGRLDRSKARRLASTCVGVLAALACWPAAQAQAADLLAVYRLAIEHDPGHRAARKERDAIVEERDIGRAGLLPRISYQYQTSRSNAELSQPDLFGNAATTNRSYSSYSSQLNLQQPVFDWRAISAYRQGVARADFAQAQFMGREQELAVRVTQAYTDALYAMDLLDLVQAQRRAYREQLSANAHWLEAGEGTKTDMLETQARYDLTLAQEVESQDALDAALRELQGITGQAWQIGELAPLRREFQIQPLVPGAFGQWQAQAVRHNPELQAMAHAIEAAGSEVEKARSGHLPKVALYASAGRNRSVSESTYDQRYVTNSVGVQIDIPLYAGGGVSADLRRAVDSQDKLRYERDAKMAEVLNGLRKQFNLFNSSVAKIRAYELAVESSRELVTAMKRSAAGGERVNADVLDAEQRYYKALRNLAQARYAYLQSWVKVKWYAGTLAEADMATASRYFQLRGTGGAAGSNPGQRTR